MIEVMIPSMIWDDEEWIIRKIKEPSDAVINLKYCDGKVENVIFDLDEVKSYKSTINDLFKTYSWLSKVIMMKGEFIKVFKRS